MLTDSLLIRADASLAIGTGHAMRCLALAQAWQAEGGSVCFVGRLTPALAERFESEGINVQSPGAEPGTPEDAIETARRAEEKGASWVVIDGYHFGGEYQRQLREEGRRVLFIDDYGHADRYDADLILNQNIDAEATLYEERASHTDLLLGPKFALLRREFWPWREPRRTPRKRASRVLVTLGGADPDNLTTRIVRGLGQFDAEDVRVTVLVGGSNPHEEAVRAAAKASGESVEVRSDVDDMASLMAECDVAVSAGGSTCWELAFMGIPNVIVVLAENQQGIANGLDEAGTAINLGWHEEVGQADVASALVSILRDEHKHLKMAKSAMEIVDGWGADRVVCDLTDQLFLRPVQKKDCKTLWRWANDSKVRERAYNSEPIPWEEHRKWFREKLEGESTIYIAEEGGDPVGQIRFDLEQLAGQVDVSVDSGERGQGYGTELIKKGTRRFLQNSKADRAVAYVKVSNEPSRRAFEKAGYALENRKEVNGEESYILYKC